MNGINLSVSTGNATDEMGAAEGCLPGSSQEVNKPGEMSVIVSFPVTTKNGCSNLELLPVSQLTVDWSEHYLSGSRLIQPISRHRPPISKPSQRAIKRH